MLLLDRSYLYISEFIRLRSVVGFGAAFALGLSGLGSLLGPAGIHGLPILPFLVVLGIPLMGLAPLGDVLYEIAD